MKNLDLILGKKVISLSQGEMIGYVLDICTSYDLKYINGFLIVDEESEEELFLPLEKVVSQNDNCVFVENSSDMEFHFGGQTYNPLGKMVYDRKGVDLGKVVDLSLTGNKIDKLITEKGEIKQKYIYSNGNDCIIFSTTKKKQNNNPIFEEQNNDRKMNPKVEIMTKDQEKPKNFQITSPTKLNMNSSMLLNKLTTCDIVGLNNELIAKKNEIITKKIIEKAKKHNKLNYLIFNSK